MSGTLYDLEVERMRATNYILASEPILNNVQAEAIESAIELIANTDVRDNRVGTSLYRRARHMLVEIYQTFALQYWYAESGFDVQVCDLAIRSFARISGQLSLEPFIAIYLASPRKGPLRMIQFLGPPPRRPSLDMDYSNAQTDQWHLPIRAQNMMPQSQEVSQPAARPSVSGEVWYPQLPLIADDMPQQASTTETPSKKDVSTQAGLVQQFPSEVPYPKLPLDKIEAFEPPRRGVASAQVSNPQLRVPKVELPPAANGKVRYPELPVTRFDSFTVFPQLSYPPMPHSNAGTAGASSSAPHFEWAPPAIHAPQPLYPRLSMPKVERRYRTRGHAGSSAASRQNTSGQTNQAQGPPRQPATQPRPIY